MTRLNLLLAACALAVFSVCAERADAASPAVHDTLTDGGPYVLEGTQVWSVPDPVSDREYDVFISLPPSYADDPDRRYPVLYVTDADYAFPIIRQIARRVNLNGPVIDEFILVGLSYSRNDTPVASRNRDYTPTPNGPRRSSAMVHGQGAAYQAYLKTQAIPFVEDRFQADPAHRVLLGHSYGGLLGAQILFSDPDLFRSYVLGSPSFWYDQRHIMNVEVDYAATHDDLAAEVFMYIGAYEAPGSSPRHSSIDMVGDMRNMRRTLESRGYPSLRIETVVLEDEDHLTVAPVGFTRALMAVLPAN